MLINVQYPKIRISFEDFSTNKTISLDEPLRIVVSGLNSTIGTGGIEGIPGSFITRFIYNCDTSTRGEYTIVGQFKYNGNPYITNTITLNIE